MFTLYSLMDPCQVYNLGLKLKGFLALLAFTLPINTFSTPLLKSISNEMRELAVEKELIDPNTADMYFRPDVGWKDEKGKETVEVRTDLTIIQPRYKEIKSTPPIWAPLPSQKFLEDGIDFNLAYQKYLQDQMDLLPFSSYNYKIYSEAMSRAKRLYDLYSDARMFWILDTRFDKRVHLKNVMKGLGGAEVMLSGYFPPPVPLEYFRPRD